MAPEKVPQLRVHHKCSLSKFPIHNYGTFLFLSSYDYDLGEPAIPDICDDPKMFWLLIEDQYVSFGTGDVYTYASTIHKRKKFVEYPNPYYNFDVTVSLLYPGSAGTVAEMTIIDTGTYIYHSDERNFSIIQNILGKFTLNGSPKHLIVFFFTKAVSFEILMGVE